MSQTAFSVHARCGLMMFQIASRPLFGNGNGIAPLVPVMPRPSWITSAVTAFFLTVSQTQSAKRKSRWLGYTFIRYESGYRSEEHTSELQSLMRISYAVFCLTKKKHT